MKAKHTSLFIALVFAVFMGITAAQDVPKFELNPAFRELQRDSKRAGQSEMEATVDAQANGGSDRTILPMSAFRPSKSRLTIRGHVELKPDKAPPIKRLVLTLTPDEAYHVFAYEDTDTVVYSKPTLIVVTSDDFVSGRPTTDAALYESKALPDSPPRPYHEGEVTWTADLYLADDVESGASLLTGVVGFQTCTGEQCDFPRGVAFEAELGVGQEKSNSIIPLKFVESNYGSVAATAQKRAELGNWPPPSQTTSVDAAAPGVTIVTTAGNSRGVTASGTLDASVPAILGMAFLAGLILNVMPCVLPVIGLKIMAFVQQAGESRWRVFALNLLFSLGLLAVFLVLATVAYVAKVGWGAQFSNTGFNLILISIVFVFALAMLGVWEIPIPGFVGSGKAMDVAEREGYVGAFCKGVLTTILATPCTGPFLGPALGWAIKQPAWLNYTTFAMVGLGMASPYLIIGAFPRLISFLPKPGAWMETFKQLMGFVLMATVVWIFSFLEVSYRVRTLSLLLALAFACWWVGRIPLTASLARKIEAWTGSIGAVVAVCLVGFASGKYVIPYVIPSVALLVGLGISWLLISRTVAANRIVAWGGATVVMALALLVVVVTLRSAELPWEEFTKVRLDQLREQGQTVLVDFTADW